MASTQWAMAMADNSIPQYPYMFDPSQFTNKFSNYQGVALPWPSQYQGTPTDAQGNPIQSYLAAEAANAAMPPSTTLNSAPRNQNMGQWAINNAMLSSQYGNPKSGVPVDSVLNQMSQNNAAYGVGRQGMGPIEAARLYQIQNSGYPGTQGPMTGTGGTPGATAGGGGGGIDMGQAYLNALSNPGHVTTPGATVPQSAPPSGQSNVLQQFLQGWQNKGSPTTGAGNYNNAGFFNALKGNV